MSFVVHCGRQSIQLDAVREAGTAGSMVASLSDFALTQSEPPKVLSILFLCLILSWKQVCHPSKQAGNRPPVQSHSFDAYKEP